MAVFICRKKLLNSVNPSLLPPLIKLQNFPEPNLLKNCHVITVTNSNNYYYKLVQILQN